MTRQWEKLSEDNYSFSFDNKKIGEMKISLNSTEQKAICQIGKEYFTIRRTGFWKSNVEVLNKEGAVAAKTYNEKLFANSSILEYNNKKYKLFLHNNPLAELAIADDNNIVLAYGLNADKGKISIKTSGSPDDSMLLLDFLLWYLFVPIATDNMEMTTLLFIL